MGALYTFGSPRVGTEGFEENLEGVFHARVVHQNDLVTQVPPAFSIWPFPRYHHVGWLHHLRDDGSMLVSKKVNEDVPDEGAGITETRNLFRGMIRGVKLESLGAPTKPLKDHTPLLYTKALAEAMKRKQRGSGTSTS